MSPEKTVIKTEGNNTMFTSCTVFRFFLLKSLTWRTVTWLRISRDNRAGNDIQRETVISQHLSRECLEMFRPRRAKESKHPPQTEIDGHVYHHIVSDCACTKKLWERLKQLQILREKNKCSNKVKIYHVTAMFWGVLK